jgi:hypothetical protein
MRFEPALSKWILEKWDDKMVIGLNWIRIQSNVDLCEHDNGISD